MKKIGWLLGSTIFLWALLIYPSWLLWGDGAWVQSLTALVLCLLPALAVLIWMKHSIGSPENQVLAVLGGTGLRMFFVLGAGLLLTQALPEIYTESFWGWVGVFYLFVLALETMLILKKNRPLAG